MCDECLASRPSQQRKPDTRPSRQDRGYDAEYERNRALMLERAQANNWPCVVCGLDFALGELITAEHLIPKRLGGGNGLDNLGPAHSRCNSGWRRRTR